MGWLKKLFGGRRDATEPAHTPAASAPVPPDARPASDTDADIVETVRAAVSVVYGMDPDQIDMHGPLRDLSGGIFQIDLVEVVDQLEADFELELPDDAWARTSTPNWEMATPASLVELIKVVRTAPAGTFAPAPANPAAPERNSATLSVLMGLDAMRSGNIGGAIEAYEFALTFMLDGTMPEGLVETDHLYLDDEEGEPAFCAASRLYMNLMQPDTTAAQAAQNLATFYQWAGQPERARKCLQRALDAR